MLSPSGGVTGQALLPPQLGFKVAGPSLSEGLVESDILYESEHGMQL